MAHNITANDDTIAYGIKKIMVDSKAELKELPYKLAPGSKALDVSTMDLYLLNNHNTWVKIKNLKSGGSTSTNATLQSAHSVMPSLYSHLHFGHQGIPFSPLSFLMLYYFSERYL